MRAANAFLARYWKYNQQRGEGNATGNTEDIQNDDGIGRVRVAGRAWRLLAERAGEDRAGRPAGNHAGIHTEKGRNHHGGQGRYPSLWVCPAGAKSAYWFRHRHSASDRQSDESEAEHGHRDQRQPDSEPEDEEGRDRKSTRRNSSH